jgi:hypothetical protein
MKRVVQIFAVVFILVAVSVPVDVRADVAPPAQPPGFNPEPGTEITQVRMVAETVLIEVQASAPADSLGRAKVTADFTMRNLGSEAENMAVRFPISVSNGFGSFPEIRDFQLKVDGRNVSTRRILQTDPLFEFDMVPWAEFDATFPPGQDVQILVTYTTQGTGEYPYAAFFYIFHTGAGWRDTIGSADLIVRLPYEADSQNVIFDETTGWSLTTPGGVINGNEIKWRFENFEPGYGDDFEISLVMPSVWQKVLNERKNVANNPNDGEAWGRLGKLYKEIFFFRRGFRHDAGGQELYRLSVEAYEKALALLPDDGLWHAGFADLLAVHAYYASWEGADATAEALRSMQEIDIALGLAPNDAKVKEIAEKIYYFFPDGVELLESGYDFLWLTATPLPPTLTIAAPIEPTVTPEATSTVPAAETPFDSTQGEPAPTREAAPNPTAVPPTAKNPLCGSLLIIPLALTFLARRKRRLGNPLL